MRVLGIDVSVTGCCVGYQDTDTGYKHHQKFDTDRGQAEMLIPMVDDVINHVGITLADIDQIAVTRGPGSFTGVRIGLTTARSLGLALDIPVVGVSTLDVIARDQTDNTLCLIDTKRGDYYGQIGEGAQPRIYSEDEIAQYNGPVAKDIVPDIMTLIEMAVEGGEPPTPIYIREAEVSVSKKKNLDVIQNFQ